MKPHRVEFGTRYADDSGWERLVAVDRQNKTIQIDLIGSEATFPLEELDWLLDALRDAKYLIKEDIK